jgi:predicted metal-dependent hydrolase
MAIPIDKFVRSKRKTIALIIQPDGTLTVRAPMRMPEARIRDFVESHADWIRRARAKVRKAVPVRPKSYTEGETFLFLGQAYPLKIVPRQRSRLDFDREAFKLTKSALPKAEEAFKLWYKKQAAAFLAERVQLRARSQGFKYKKIRISSARTRWGSCSSNGTLSFTYRLIMAPLQVVDYVIVHELVHTQIRNHSKTFWRRVGEVMPDYKTSLTWLKKNGSSLV